MRELELGRIKPGLAEPGLKGPGSTHEHEGV